MEVLPVHVNQGLYEAVNSVVALYLFYPADNSYYYTSDSLSKI